MLGTANIKAQNCNQGDDFDAPLPEEILKTVNSEQLPAAVTPAMVGDLNPPSGYAFGTSSTNATCSTWGNPKTAVAHHQRSLVQLVWCFPQR
ncbi:hypothetical protein NIES2130_35425 [Scytonema sp. HK-05]|nr:hypothetical protein NIES2130_35425 [Scytonema sp. HK-05]